ncbi:hypothetical protein ACIQZD_00455 [Peribacillus sp. NPDC096447]|uniref:hypothetical protein n=1 Tax=Peribacillus sp. NPDC096447 TaxID=3364394 RepID=UPI0037FAF39F
MTTKELRQNIFGKILCPLMREWVLSQRIVTGKGVFMIHNVIFACFPSDVTSISFSRFIGGDVKDVNRTLFAN